VPAPRWVLHVDLDQFVVAVELRRLPALRGRPVLVGGTGDPMRRGVVAGASYEARAHGVRSGTPLRTALARCPDAVFLPVDRPAYEAASQEVMAVLAAHPGVLEPLGWDEAFLAVEVHDPVAEARAVQREVQDATGLACSVGIGDNRLRAKTATGFGKPAGVFRLTEGNWAHVMGDLPCTALWGVGGRTATALARLGVTTVAELAAADPVRLAEEFGPRAGPRLAELGRGESSAEVAPGRREVRSRGRETTFERDVDDPEVVRVELRRLVGVLADDVAAEDRDASPVVVVLRTRPFRTRTRIVPLVPPTRQRDRLEEAALAALEVFGPTGPVRLVGVRAALV